MDGFVARNNFIRVVVWNVLILLVSSVCEPFSLYAARPSSRLPSARSALVIDRASGKVLFSRFPHIKKQPASTMKVLTALVVMDHLPLERIITVEASAGRTQPTHISLREGERFYVRDLLRALLIGSANDAAKALALEVAGSERKFADRLNEKARMLGARNSNFVTPNGLPAENQYSTAYDLIQIFKAAEKNSFITMTLATKFAVIQSLGGRKISLKNHNKMLFRDRREFIGKTGWTRTARHCFVGRIGRGGREVFVALLGSGKKWDDLRYFADRYVGGSPQGVSSRTARRKGEAGGGRYSVVQTQTALKRAGYFRPKPTGYFGKITREALIRFQKDHGLDPDGIVGPKTWAILSRYLVE